MVDLTKTYKGYVFDLDGTLVNSMPAHYSAWTATLSRYGIDFAEERFYQMGGMATFKIVRVLAEEAGLELDAKAVAYEKERLFLETLHLLEPAEKVVAIADRVRQVAPIAVATGSSRDVAHKELHQIGIHAWFGAVVTSEDVEHHKPFPDVFLEAAQRIEVLPEDCCAFEDTETGLTAARAAGMTVVDVREL